MVCVCVRERVCGGGGPLHCWAPARYAVEGVVSDEARLAEGEGCEAGAVLEERKEHEVIHELASAKVQYLKLPHSVPCVHAAYV